MDQGNDGEERNIDQVKVLSKKGLYAPLSVYTRDVVDHGSTQLSKPRKLAAALKDGALVDFLVQVGKDHNRKSNISVGKNNGSRPLSHNDINDRIRMRSLTLVGGGINTSISSELKKKKASLAIQQLTMKRKRMTRKKDTSNHVDVDTWAKLEVVNSTWNAYVHRFLQHMQVNLDYSNTRASVNSLSLTLSRVELVGSFLAILKCESHPHLVSYEGYLIGETLHTWRLATLRRHADKKKTDKSFCKVLTVPKGGGTELEVVIQRPESSESFVTDDSKATEKSNEGRSIYIRIT